MNILNIMLLFSVFGLQGASEADTDLFATAKIPQDAIARIAVSPDLSAIAVSPDLSASIRDIRDLSLQNLREHHHSQSLQNNHLKALKAKIDFTEEEIHRTQVVLLRQLSKHREQITQENETITAQLLEKLATLPEETAKRLFAELSASQRTMLEELTSQHLAMHSETRQVITGESEGIRRLLKEEFDKQSIFDRKEFDALATKMDSLEAATTRNMETLQTAILASIKEHSPLLDTLERVVSSQVKPLHLKYEALETMMRDTQANAAGALTSWAATTGHIIEIRKIMASLQEAQAKSFAAQAQTIEQIKDDLKKIKDKSAEAAPISFMTPLVASPASQPAFALGTSGTSGKPARKPSTAPTTASQPPLQPLSAMFASQQTPTLAPAFATPTAASAQQPLPTKPAPTKQAPATSAAANSTDVVPMTGIKTFTTPTTPTTAATTTTFPFPAPPQTATAPFGYKSEGTSQTKPPAATPAPATASAKKSVTFTLEQPTTKPPAATPAPAAASAQQSTTANSTTDLPNLLSGKQIYFGTYDQAKENICADFPNGKGATIISLGQWDYDETQPRGYRLR